MIEMAVTSINDQSKEKEPIHTRFAIEMGDSSLWIEHSKDINFDNEPIVYEEFGIERVRALKVLIDYLLASHDKINT